MLIWKGWGILVVGIALAALFAGDIVARLLGAGTAPGESVGTGETIAMGVALALAAIPTWYLGKRLNRNAVRKLVDPNTGAEVTLNQGHDLFFVPIQWWAPVMVVLGLLMAVTATPGTYAG
jgi:hypothetical protein